MNRVRLKKIFFKVVLTIIAVVVIFFVVGNIWVVNSTKDRIYVDVKDVPANDVALVLGTSKYSRKGKSNLFFKTRIEAAVKLYKAGKVKHFILSGDSTAFYNEPKDMKSAMMKYGIPPTVITLDHFGFKTFDSVVRSKKVFKQKSLTIITQEFHAYRALFISDFYGLEAVAFTTSPLPASYSFLTLFREYLARGKAIVSLYVLDKQPQFLGEEVDINI